MRSVVGITLGAVTAVLAGAAWVGMYQHKGWLLVGGVVTAVCTGVAGMLVTR